APVVLLDNWQELYSQLIEQLADELPDKIKKELFIEIIFMTYSYIHRAINAEAFPNAVKLYDKSLMTGRGRGKYCYRSDIRLQAEECLKKLLQQKLNGIPVIYIV
ncbi:MAG: spore photoproduct lyase, partial [Syntrophomonas sp.]|uniref:spore photoproduct lyase family protein n=1 Tax=Syntrophomonas sp. TaxID=2053627 RepID=UPI0034598B78|nr:spore photoproduct lyase [Syntrophomonas sp.]